MTDFWLVNPTVGSNTEGWTVEKQNGTGPTTNYGETEFWQSNFDFYQYVTLPAGTYELGLSGFHRAGTYSTYLYAGSNRVLFPGVESSVANTMAAAKDYFDLGQGRFSLIFSLEEESNDIKIGIENTDNSATDKWTIFRNFTLYYKGAATVLLSLKMSASGGGAVAYAGYVVSNDSVSCNLQEGDDVVLTITPATGYELATVMLNGTKDVTAQVVDGQLTLSNITASTTVAVTFKRQDLKWDAATLDNPLDVTQMIVNPDFDGNIDGWTFGYSSWNNGYQNATYENGDIVINQFAEAWVGTGIALADGAIEQTLADMPAGIYLLEADVIAVNQSGSDNAVTGVYLFMEDQTGDSRNAVSTGNGVPEHFSISFTHPTDGALTLGLKTASTTANWIAGDNFKLSYLGGISQTLITLEISVTSGGIVNYEGKTISNSINSFYLTEGDDALLTLTPNNGYEVSQVLLNGTDDVTGQVLNGQLTLSNITVSTTIHVIFDLDLDNASLDNPIDITHLIVNPDCSSLTGWTFWGHDIPEYLDGSWATWHLYTTDYQNGEAFLDTFIERWVYNDTQLEDGALYQTVTDLPNGVYQIEADVIACQQGNSSTGHEKGTYLFAASGDKRDSIPVLTGNGVPQHFVYYSKVKDNTLTLGMETVNSEMNWIAVDNWKLEYVGAIDDAIKVTADNRTREYGEENPKFTYSSEGADLEGTPAITCEATATSPVGDYPIVISKGTVTNYNDSYVNGTLTITKAPLTITVSSASKKQGDPMPEFTVTYSGFKNGETAAVLTTQPTITCEATAASSAGTYPIIVSGAEAQNYNISYVNGILTILPPETAMVTYYVKDKDGNVLATESASVHMGDEISEIPVSLKRDMTSYENDSPLLIQEGDKTYEFTAVATFNIPFPISTAEEKHWVNLTYQKDGKQILYSNMTSVRTVAYAEELTEEEEYLWAIYGNPYSNFKIKNKAAYGETEGYLWDDNTTAKLSNRNKAEPLMFTSQNNGYVFTSATNGESICILLGMIGFDANLTPLIFNISDAVAPVFVYAKDTTIVYGSEIPSFTFWSEGTVLNGAPTLTCEATESSPVGDYPIVISKGTVSNNHDHYFNGTLTITKAPLTITANDCERGYGDDSPSFTASYVGFKNNESNEVLNAEPTFSCEGRNVGSYPIVISGAEAQNYEISFVNGTLTITKALLTVGVKEVYTCEEGEPIPDFELAYSGWKLGETEEVLTERPVAECTATVGSRAGTYPITISGGSAENYELSYVPGTLTITALPLTSLGDVNRDGKVSVGDVVKTANYILGRTPKTPFNVRLADQAPRRVTRRHENTDVLTLEWRSAGGMAIWLQNAMAYTAFQMTLSLPDGMTAADIRLTPARRSNLQLVTGQLPDGRLRVLAYSMDNSPINGNEGALVEIQTNGPLQGEAVVDGILFVTPQGVIHAFAPLVISPTTDVVEIENSPSMERPGSSAKLKIENDGGALYDMSGRRVCMNRLTQGLYVVRQGNRTQKITVK